MTPTLKLLESLIAIDSVNPSLVADAAGETEIATFIQNWLQDQDIETQWLEPVIGRPSIVAKIPGTGGGRSLMFNGHIDVVGVDGYEGKPFHPVIQQGRMYGRGSSDMKSGVAAMMIAATRIAKTPFKGDIILACVADEEHGSIGTEALLASGVRTDSAIVCEPVGYEIVTAHKGFMWFDIDFHGVAAHGSRPDKGVDAIIKAGKFLSALEAYSINLAHRPAHPRLGQASVHASLISGGNELSTYPAHCRLSLERRCIPGENSEQIINEIQQLLDKLSQQDATFKATLKPGLYRPPYECRPDAAITSALQETATTLIGHAPAISQMHGWTDCALLGAAGIDSILIGADGKGGHSTLESVSTQSVTTLADLLFHTAKAFCN